MEVRGREEGREKILRGSLLKRFVEIFIRFLVLKCEF